MDSRLTPQQENAIIEDALKNVPLAPMPHSITASVKVRIQKNIRPELVTWNDFVLSLIVAISVGSLFFAFQSLPPIFIAKLRVQEIILYQDFLVNARWLAPVLLFGLIVFISALVILYLFQMTTDHRR